MYELLICVVLLLARLVQGLPTNCITSISNYEHRIRCDNPDRIPKPLSNQTTEFVISCSENGDRSLITRLSVDSFSHLPYLRSFESRGCPIEVIEDGLFARNHQLTNLTIVGANITEIHLDRLFSNNTCALEMIHIENCSRLTTLITPGIDEPKGLQRMRLTTLRLNRTSVPLSEISKVIAPSECCLRELEIHASVVALTGLLFPTDLFNLTRLSLDYSELDDLNMLIGVTVAELSMKGCVLPEKNLNEFENIRRSLVRLDLSDTFQSQMYLYEMPQLRELILANNKIEIIPKDYFTTIFSRTPSLSLLDLRSNLITTIPLKTSTAAKEVKERLGQLDIQLSGNQIHCNCELEWLLRDPRFAKLVANLPCFTLATSSQNTTYQIIMSTELLGDLFPSPDSTDLKLACFKPGSPLIAIHKGKRLERVDSKEHGEIVYKLAPKGRKNLTIKCTSAGDPPPTIIWKDTKTGVIKSDRYITSKRGIIASSKGALLHIDEFNTTKGIVDMTCEAHTGLGRSSSRLRIDFDADPLESPANELKSVMTSITASDKAFTNKLTILSLLPIVLIPQIFFF